MPNPITLDALRILDAIDRHQSFAGAAEALFRVPSAISYTVKKLESDLDIVIFDRSKRRAEFTDTGKLLLKHGRAILEATDELSHMVVQAESGWELEVRICIDTILVFDPIYELIAAFQASYPHIEVKLIEESLGGTMDALESGRVDLAIGVSHQEQRSHYASMDIGEVEVVFAVASDHPLAKESAPISHQQVKQYPSIVVSDSSRKSPPRSIGIFAGQRRIAVPSMSKKISSQLLGLGVGYLPLHLIQHELQTGQLVAIAVEPVTNKGSTLSIVWDKRNQGLALKWFVERLQLMDRYRFMLP